MRLGPIAPATCLHKQVNASNRQSPTELSRIRLFTKPTIISRSSHELETKRVLIPFCFLRYFFLFFAYSQRLLLPPFIRVLHCSLLSISWSLYLGALFSPWRRIR